MFTLKGFHLSDRMNFVKILFLILFSLNLVSCDQEGSGVVTVSNPKAPVETPTNPEPVEPPFTGPFGGPVDGDSAVPDPSEYVAPYESWEIQAMIWEASAGDTIYLTKDAELTMGIDVNKSLNFASHPSLSRPVRIKAQSLPSLFSVSANNISFYNLIFDLRNVGEFLTSEISMVTGKSLYAGLNINRTQFILRGLSSLIATYNGVSMIQSSVIGLSNIRRDSIGDNRHPLVFFQGDNISITGSNLIDATDNYTVPLYFSYNQGITVRENVIRGFVWRYMGPIGITHVTNGLVQGNFLHDANTDKVNLDFGYDEEEVGSIAIGVEQSTQITDGGQYNYYNAQKFTLTDELEGGSTNISLTPGLQILPFDKDDLFNYPSTEDFTPLCDMSKNPSISTTPKSTWSSYQLGDGTILYYAGAIRPACL